VAIGKERRMQGKLLGKHRAPLHNFTGPCSSTSLPPPNLAGQGRAKLPTYAWDACMQVKYAVEILS